MLKKTDFLNYDDSVVEAAAAAAKASIRRQAKSSDKSTALRSMVNVGSLRQAIASRKLASGHVSEMRSRGPSEGRDSLLAGDRLKVSAIGREGIFGSKRPSGASFTDKMAGQIQTKARGAAEYAPTPEPDSAENLISL